jgi:hypothetical protein
MKLPDGSRPHAYEGFQFKDIQQPLPPLTAKIWADLPYKGPLNEFLNRFPVPLTAHQLAGAGRSGRVEMVREKDRIWIVRDIDPEYQEVLTKAKRLRYERQERKQQRRWVSTYESGKPKGKPLPPFTRKIWPYLPYHGAVSEFPIPVSIRQLQGACKTRLVAMVSRKDEIWMVRNIDGDYERVIDLAKERRVMAYGELNSKQERYYLWQEFFSVFPYPAA